ncbi:DUF4190 domain-containing protein [Mumia sp. DW29H23]|uniref:DUF4190 domain-containing protein n=1 Tax=Mumia sp. DW29H23 TaxID=3421241 RepID=UPI003D693315
MTTTPHYKPGDVANGHVLTQDGQWVPLAGSAPQPPNPYEASPRDPRPEPKNGLAVAALIIGVVGLVLGLIPLTGWLAIMAGFTAVVLGFVAWQRKRKGRATAGKTALSGVVSGALAIVMGVVGMVMFFNVVDDVSDDLDDITDEPEVVTVTEGEAFTYDGFQADAGWKIQEDEFGTPTITSFRVTNVDHEDALEGDDAEAPMFTIRLYRGDENVGEITATGNEIAAGQSTKMESYSTTEGGWTGFDTIKVDEMF